MNLTPELDRFVNDVVAMGEFNSASEVHRAALAAMAREREERALRLARLRQELQNGLDSGPAGDLEDVDAFLEECSKDALGDTRRGT